MKLASALLIIAGLSLSGRAQANSEEMVTSIHHGGNPFMVVSSDTDGGSKRQPGFYGRSQEGWRLIVPGETLRDGHKGYWQKQLKLSQKDELYHTLVIQDGSLYLLNLYSDKSEPGTFLKIGSGDFPLTEVITGQKRTIPAIKSVRDISFFALEQNLEELDYQLLLVSVRCESCNGDGITFVMAVKAMTDQHRNYELVGKPWVLDYRFYPQNQLGELAQFNPKTRTHSLKSQIAQDFLLHSDLSHYGQHQSLVESRFKTLIAKESSSGLPSVTVSLDNGQIGTAMIPSAKFQVPGLTLSVTQHYNIRNQSGSLTITSGSVEKTLPLLLDFKNEKDPAIFGESDPAISIFAADGRLHLSRVNLSDIHVVELGPAPDHTQRYEIYDLLFDSGESDDMPIKRKLLVTSTVFGNGTGKVEAYRLAFYNTGAVIVEDRWEIMSNGLAQHELQARLRFSSKEILFDTVTPSSRTIDEYNQLADKSKPYINLSESSSKGLKYSFAEPLRIVPEIGFEYRVYADSPLLPNPTGLYAAQASDGSKPNHSLGQALSREHDANPDDPTSISKIPIIGEVRKIKIEKFGTIWLKLIPLDASFSDGKSSFKVTVALGSDHKDMPVQFLDIPAGIPIDNLLAVRAVAGRKDHDNEIALVFSMELQQADGKRTGRTVVVNLKGTINKDQISFRKNGDAAVVTQQAVEASQIMDRFVWDESGRVHFVIDPKVPRDERRFEVFDLFSRTTVKPNATQGYKLLWDQKADDLDNYHWDDRKVAWRLYGTELEKRFPFIEKRRRDAEAGYLWGQLFELLDKMAQERSSEKVRVLLVPADLKKYANELILARYARKSQSERDQAFFSANNRSLKVFQFDPESASQDDILDNLDSIQKGQRDSNLILADMAHITRVNRPNVKSANFQIRKLSSAESSFGEAMNTDEEAYLPHALYLLAAGEAIQPDELMRRKERPYSTLIVSTPEEWEDAKKQAETEMEAGLDRFFETIEFPLPTAEDRVRLLSEIFNDRSVSYLRLQFDAKGISRSIPANPDAQMTKLLEYAVMRVASEAENAKSDALNSFVQFRNLFAQQVLKDRTVRRTKIVDKAFVERVLTSVFDIPVNLESLPADDALSILSRKDAVRQLQDKGVAGPFAIKARVIKTMLSVLKFDPTRSIPSSHIFIGESGSGKTRMVTGILDWLFPTKYDFNNPGKNSEAQSIRINVGKLVESKKDGSSGEQMTVDEVKEHINNFLTTGFRGAIFFDDFHAASDKVRTELLGFARTLLETQGLYQARTFSGKDIVSVPLRHLHLFIALNPTEEQARIDAFRKEKDRPANFDEILLASLSTKDLKIERSFLKRIGAIHNLMKFPHGAKAPALSNDTLLIARDVMLRKQKLVINSSGAIRLVADAFPQMDARTFLSTASSSLVDQVDPQLFPTGTLFHVIPGYRRVHGRNLGVEPDESDKGRIEDFIQRNTKVMPLNDSSPEAQLHFISTLVRNFRIPLQEQLLISLEDDGRFSESIENQRNFLLPALMAMRNHIGEHYELPLSELNLDPNGFGLKTAGDRDLFREIMNEISKGQNRYFPFPIPKNEREEGWDVLITGTSGNASNSRTAMITKYYHQVHDVLQKYSKRYYMLDSLEGLPNSEKWVRSLPNQISDAGLRPSVHELRELFWKFIADINDPSLRGSSEQGQGHLTPYAIARIFYYLIDKAITELPWIQFNKHIIRSLDLIVQDQVLGQSPGVKSYFFEYKYSPIRAASPELILQLVDSSQLGSEYSPASQGNIHEDYKSYCERLLGGGK